jgi:hypothetical protein
MVPFKNWTRTKNVKYVLEWSSPAKIDLMNASLIRNSDPHCTWKISVEFNCNESVHKIKFYNIGQNKILYLYSFLDVEKILANSNFQYSTIRLAFIKKWSVF